MQRGFLLFGYPGSGKGTQGKLLAPILNYAYLSMGQFLREYSKHDNALARKIKDTIDGGHMIDQETFLEILDEVKVLISHSPGVIFDGFPRRMDQVPILEQIIKENNNPDVKAILIDVPKEKLLERITQRGKEGRADDSPEVIETRFKQYGEKSAPINDYFAQKGLLITINGDQPVEAVHQEILNKLGLK